MPTVLEIAVQDVAGAVASASLGADRLELCAALAATGGITPSIGLLDAVLAAVPERVGVHVLVRPRAGSFVYAAEELDVQVAGRARVRRGRCGGCRRRSPHARRVGRRRRPRAPGRRRRRAARSRSTGRSTRSTTLGPAIDDARRVGVTRVLTSGGAARSIDGVARLASTTSRTPPDACRSWPVAGCEPADIPALVAVGVDAVHLSASRHVDEAGGPGGGSGGYTTTDPAVVAEAVAALRRR